MRKPIIYCPCCKNKMDKVDDTEYMCEDCDVVFDIVRYSIEKWKDANSIMIED
jgi:anaerobic ribonucleoside-triphosphate reductase